MATDYDIQRTPVSQTANPFHRQYIEINPSLSSWYAQNKGFPFTRMEDAYTYMFGPGAVVDKNQLLQQGIDIPEAYGGQYFYKPASGNAAQSYRTLPEYDDPGSFMDNLGPYLVGGIIGGGLLAGGLGGAGAAGGDLLGSAGAGAGAGFDVGAGVGGLEGVGGAGTGGLSGVGGFSWTDPTTWFGNTPPGLGTAGQQVFGNADAGAGGGFDIGDAAGGLSGAAGAGATGGGMDLSSLLGGTNWLNLLGSLGGGLLQYLGATNAADTQEQAAAQSIAALLGMYNQNRADLAPYREAGYGALGNLTNLTTPGKQLDTAMLDPGYQFRYDEGMRQLENQLRGAGKFYSGDAIKGGQQYAQNFATNEFGNVFNRNAALAGIGQTAVNTGVGAGTTAAGQVSNSLLDAGNARASGYVGGLNALSGGIGSYLNNQNQNNLLQLLLAGRY